MTTRDPSDWINRFIVDLEGALSELAPIKGAITTHEAQEALYRSLGLENVTALLYQDLPKSRIVEILSVFDFRALRPEVLTEVSFEESLLPEGTPRYLTEQQVKIKGEIWTIHKNDADPFPSNPHAHNYAEQIVLHLGNGKLFRQRKEIGKLEEKKFLRLRDAIRNVPLPPLE